MVRTATPTASDRSVQGRPAVPRLDPDQRWKAAGVRQSLLLRVLSVQRHDVLGPLSVMRMGLALMRRRLDAPSPDVADLRTRTHDLEQQLVAALEAVAALRLWDVAAEPWTDLRTAADDAVAMLRLGMGLRGHRLDDARVASHVDPGPAPAASEAVGKSWRRACPDAHYALLGLLAHAMDTATTPSAFELQLAPERVRLTVEPLAGAVLPSPTPPLPPGAQALDARAFGWLLADLGARCRRDADAFELDWPQRAGPNVPALLLDPDDPSSASGLAL